MKSGLLPLIALIRTDQNQTHLNTEATKEHEGNQDQSLPQRSQRNAKGAKRKRAVYSDSGLTNLSEAEFMQ